ncbi:hypothetical protein ACNSOS_02825 [Aliarcobacter vitoriensis]|uniref:hypothetical protein n=1 Tax=Aliarcobacter vitoriensis TaxID=2011099 RepID=UPI003AADB055
MFKQVKSAVFWYYLYKFRKRAILIFFLLLVALFSGLIYGDVVEYLKLTQNIEYLKYVLFAKWLIILFNILFSIYLILSLFKKDVEVKEKEVKKEQKIPQEEKFTPREKELLHKKKLKTKADVLLNNQ